MSEIVFMTKLILGMFFVALVVSAPGIVTYCLYKLNGSEE
jgi:hypothetical protein